MHPMVTEKQRVDNEADRFFRIRQIRMMSRIFSVMPTGIMIVVLLIAPLSLQADRGLTVSKMQSEKRLALVIGNGAYSSSPLRNPVNDANAMAIALQKFNFTVIKKTNVDQRGMEDAIRQFGEKISDDDPYSSEDDTMRQYARQRLEYWQD